MSEHDTSHIYQPLSANLAITAAKGAPAAQVSAAINAFEARLRAGRPDAKWVLVEPDLEGAA